MSGVLRTRRGLAGAVAAVIGIILLLLLFALPKWRVQAPHDSMAGMPAETTADRAPDSASQADSGRQSASKSAEAPAAAPPPETRTPVPPLSSDASGEHNAAAGVAEDIAPSTSAPSFDIVRIEPTGDSVIAARAAPHAEITLLDGSSPIAHATADANGQVAFLPPPLKPGEHSLSLVVSVPGAGKSVSSQTVVVSVPDSAKTAPMVALIQPNKPATILSAPIAADTNTPGVPDSATPTTTEGDKATDKVAIRSVEVESTGSFFASGKAVPGSQSRVYLNDSYVATVTADQFGKWELQIRRGMKPGRYAVRIDQVEPKTGQVVARAEVPFEYPRSASSLRKRLAGSGDAMGTAAARSVANGGQSRTGPASAGVAQQGSAKTSPAATGSAASSIARAPDTSAQTEVRGTPPSAKDTVSAPGTTVASAQNTSQDRSRVTSNSGSKLASSAISPSQNGATPEIREDAGGRSDEAASARVASKGARPEAASSTTNDLMRGEQPVSPRAGNPLTTLSRGTTAPADRGDDPAIPSKPEAKEAKSSADTLVGVSDADQSRPRTPGASVAGKAAMASQAPGLTVVADLVTAKVNRGDSLWRISRKMLGHGIRYTQIYAINTRQIRDPKLIYPGQVLVMPQSDML